MRHHPLAPIDYCDIISPAIQGNPEVNTDARQHIRLHTPSLLLMRYPNEHDAHALLNEVCPCGGSPHHSPSCPSREPDLNTPLSFSLMQGSQHLMSLDLCLPDNRLSLNPSLSLELLTQHLSLPLHLLPHAP